METQKKGRGCLFYGCITIIVVIVSLFVGTYLGTRYALNAVVTKYTSNAPAEVPDLNLSEEERTRRVGLLQTNLQETLRTGGMVSLDEIDLNLLLEESPDLKNFADQMHIGIETNLIKAQVSIPLDQFAEWKKVAKRFRSKQLSGRYLNATLSLKPGFQNKKLELELVDVTVNGESLPETFTGKIDLDALTQEANQDPEVRRVLDRIRAVEVSDGQVKIEVAETPPENPQPL